MPERASVLLSRSAPFRADGSGIKSTLEYGTLVLGTDADFDGEISLSDLVPDGQGGFDAYGMKFTPFDADYLLSRDEIMKKKQRILFRVKTGQKGEIKNRGVKNSL